MTIAEANLESTARTLADFIAKERGGRNDALIVGLSGAQGTGKSTLATLLAAQLAPVLQVTVVSLDDLYLGREARERVASIAHPLFRTRGVPGTHDAALGIWLLDALRTEARVLVPRFDKARDDRIAGEIVDGPLDVVIFEGWCLGAQPQPAAALTAPLNELEAHEDRDGRWRIAVNDALAGIYRELFAQIDVLIMLEAPDWLSVCSWRAQQERELIARMGRGMTPAELDRFMLHFERITRDLLRDLPDRADVRISLSRDHTVRAVEFAR